MKSRQLFLAIGLTTAALAQAQSGARVTCWDDHGKTVCGDAPPSSSASAASRKVDASGITVQTTSRAPTAAERTAQEAAAKAAEAQAEARKAAERQQSALTQSYPTEEALLQDYRQRIATADGSVKTANSALSSQRLALAQALQRAADLELDGKPVPPNLRQTVMKQRAVVVSAITNLAQLQKARAELDGAQATAIAQYRAGKNHGAAEQPTP